MQHSQRWSRGVFNEARLASEVYGPVRSLPSSTEGKGKVRNFVNLCSSALFEVFFTSPRIRRSILCRADLRHVGIAERRLRLLRDLLAQAAPSSLGPVTREARNVTSAFEVFRSEAAFRAERTRLYCLIPRTSW
jgi:hypothetical protein